MKKTITNKTMYRCYANLFSSSKFQQLLLDGDTSYLESKFYKYSVSDASVKTIGDFYKYAYNKLLANYRNEYVYKNLIINKLLLKRYSLSTTTILNEFKIGHSIADLVLLNGTSKVFEIKTELDSLYRIESQIADYKKVFENIYIVTHIEQVEKFIKEIDKTIGVLALTNNFTLKTIREATQDTSQLDSAVMIKCLRKNEYTNIIFSHFRHIPTTTPVKYFSACRDKFKEIPKEQLHDLIVAELKKRTIKGKEQFTSDLIVPPEFKYLFWNLDPAVDYYDKFADLLNIKLAQ